MRVKRGAMLLHAHRATARTTASIATAPRRAGCERHRTLEGGAEAHAVARGYAREIDLLLTDVVMPGMDGRTLSEQLRDLRPNLRVILMSGYAADLTTHRDAVDSGLAYIQKPFAPEELATKVRGVLDSPD